MEKCQIIHIMYKIIKDERAQKKRRNEKLRLKKTEVTERPDGEKTSL